ncbi:MAG: hypothetical protein JWO03_1272 [Bacteroidetes bacterium]|nr:hypothetical protein [Bacteroidota bacterium]
MAFSDKNIYIRKGMRNLLFITGIILLFLNSCVSSGKIKDTPSSLNQFDGKGLKTGHWVRYDTLVNVNISLSPVLGHGTSPTDVNRTKENRDTLIGIVRSEGDYKLNKPDGIWQFKVRDTLRKEIKYQFGTIRQARLFSPQGTLQFSGYTKDDSFMYEKFDQKGKKLSEGSIPIELLQLESNNQIYF